jgi:hypothetical protein
MPMDEARRCLKHQLLVVGQEIDEAFNFNTKDTVIRPTAYVLSVQFRHIMLLEIPGKFVTISSVDRHNPIDLCSEFLSGFRIEDSDGVAPRIRAQWEACYPICR